jgi:protein phosphatase 2C-like protein
MQGAFEIAGGSVTGREHVAAGRNNQDAFCWSAAAEATVAVVADGCGSGRYSEVGAQVGARLLTAALREQAVRFETEKAEDVLERIRLDVLAQLRVLANAMGGSLSQVVGDYFLFTTLGFVIGPQTATVFGIGDGVVCVNGRIRKLVAARNEPAYLGYGLTSSTFTDDDLRFVVYERLPADEARTLLVGTDGAFELAESGEAAVAEFWTSDRFFSNPYIVGRRLSQWKRVIALPDDTTLVVARRAGA